MTPSAAIIIAKTFIKLIRLVSSYEKGELKDIEPSVWDKCIGTEVEIFYQNKRADEVIGVTGTLVEKTDHGVTILKQGTETTTFVERVLEYIPHGRILHRACEKKSGLPSTKTSTPMPEVKPPRRKVRDNPK